MTTLGSLAPVLGSEIDPLFGTSGEFTFDATSYNALCSSYIINNDNTFILYGVNSSTSDFLSFKFTANGSLDTSYGTSGVVTNPLNTSPYTLQGLVTTVDLGGKIYLATVVTNTVDSLQYCCLASFNYDGSINTAFGTNGITIFIYENGINSNICLRSFNNYLIVYFSYNSTNGFKGICCTKVLTTGSIDTSFGTSGFTTYTLAGHDCNFTNGMITSDQFIYLVGNIKLSFTEGDTDGLIIKLDQNGSYVNTFGVSGVLINNDPLLNNDCVEIGEFDTSSFVVINNLYNDTVYSLSVIKYSSTGSVLWSNVIKTGTGSLALSMTGFNHFLVNQSLILYFVTFGANSNLCSINPTNGDLNKYFGTNGFKDFFGLSFPIQISYAGDNLLVFSISLTTFNPIGSKLINGSLLNSNYVNTDNMFSTNFSVDTVTSTSIVSTSITSTSITSNSMICINAPVIPTDVTNKQYVDSLVSTNNVINDEVVTSFGDILSPGFKLINISTNYTTNSAIGSDNKINIIFGNATNLVGFNRYNNDGTLDTQTTVDLGFNIALISTVLVQTDNKIIFTTIRQSDSFPVVVRLDSAGVLDATYATGGILVISDQGTVVSLGDRIPAGLQTGNKCVLAFSTSTQSVITRYTSAGILDTTFNLTGIVIVSSIGANSIFVNSSDQTFACIELDLFKITVDGNGSVLATLYSTPKYAYELSDQTIMSVCEDGTMNKLSSVGTVISIITIPNTSISTNSNKIIQYNDQILAFIASGNGCGILCVNTDLTIGNYFGISGIFTPGFSFIDQNINNDFGLSNINMYLSSDGFVVHYIYTDSLSISNMILMKLQINSNINTTSNILCDNIGVNQLNASGMVFSETNVLTSINNSTINPNPVCINIYDFGAVMLYPLGTKVEQNGSVYRYCYINQNTLINVCMLQDISQNFQSTIDTGIYNLSNGITVTNTSGTTILKNDPRFMNGSLSFYDYPYTLVITGCTFSGSGSPVTFFTQIGIDKTVSLNAGTIFINSSDYFVSSLITGYPMGILTSIIDSIVPFQPVSNAYGWIQTKGRCTAINQNVSTFDVGTILTNVNSVSNSDLVIRNTLQQVAVGRVLMNNSTDFFNIPIYVLLE
jgi:uncharacterized delta-60 repeat protein